MTMELNTKILEKKYHIVNESDIPLQVVENITQRFSNNYDSIYVCDVGEIVRRHFAIKAAIPRVDPFYAVKCNDEQFILEVLSAIGAGFDCASDTEIEKVIRCNASPDRIIFANPIKAVSHLNFAASHNVLKMTFDCEDELFKIKRYYPDAELVLRFRCDAKDLECKALGLKFGCDPSEEGPSLLRLAAKLNLNVIGVSFHVGSGCSEYDVYDRAIKHAHNLFEYAKKVGYQFTFLDLGGGLPGRLSETVQPYSIVINQALDNYFPADLYPHLHVISELGRYYVTAGFTLAAKVVGKKYLNSAENNEKCQKRIFYYVYESNFVSFIDSVFELALPKPIALRKTNMSTIEYPSTIWGYTCDSYDKIYNTIYLPELETGEWIVFEDMGAYSLCLATKFNGLKKPRVIRVMDERTAQILLKTQYFIESDFNRDLLLNDSTIPKIEKKVFPTNCENKNSTTVEKITIQ